ncbi:uncharacterized protein LOC125676663 [Ostrea edulis]|uniref:uncharacterized protein LOC125676663 n=1 Tax=Ostrea edulis TaxID=37623 RepID=UPI0024AFEF29|nr:uncharacterized protein LOC125676663 [Ostrea edulis]
MVMIWIGRRLMVSLFITFSLQLVGGDGSRCGGFRKCCNGYRWDRNTEKCLPCEVGYYGIDCGDRCPFPSFGKECQLTCNCSKDQCNHGKGCPKGGSLEGIIMEVVTTPVPKSRMTHNISVSLRHDADVNRSFPSRDTSSVLSTTPDMPKETSIQSDAASMWKTLNEKKVGMVISITMLGLLFLILTAMYIWVSHRIRVETNNRGKATEDSDENSAPRMVMSCSRGSLFVSMLVTFFLLLVSGNDLPCGGFSKCCSGYKWDGNIEQCLVCALGYLGIYCPEQCPFPSFGKDCQLSCSCSKHLCNHAKGCQKNCSPGYFGDFCDVKCRYPSFGTECQDKCLCEQEKCDPVNGCQGITREVVTTPAPTSRMTLNISVSLRPNADVDRRFSSRDTSSVLSTTPDMQKDLVNNSLCLETPITSDAASMWKTLNGTERGMVISIATLGLLFLILTVMYIWVYHRLHVETNNRKKETEDLDENSMA